MAILNLRGRYELGMQGAPLAQHFGVDRTRIDQLVGGHAGPSVVMLRMQLPLVWMPCVSTAASLSITSAARGQRDPVVLTFWRVVKCT